MHKFYGKYIFNNWSIKFVYYPTVDYNYVVRLINCLNGVNEFSITLFTSPNRECFSTKIDDKIRTKEEVEKEIEAKIKNI